MEKNIRLFVIAGFSLKGPSGIPFALRDHTDPYEVLGDCVMTENYLKAKENGITPLLLRLNGSHGEAVLIHEQENQPVLKFKTLDATDEGNLIRIHLFPTYMIIKGRNQDYSYLFEDYANIYQLAQAIQQDLYFGKGEVEVEILLPLPLEGICLTEKFLTFSGADDGFNLVTQKGEIVAEEKIQAQLDALKEHLVQIDGTEWYFTGELSGFTVDTLLFTDIPFEVAPQELLSIFGGFAKTKTEEQSLFCSAVLGSTYFQGSRITDGIDTYAPQVQSLIDAAKSLTVSDDMKYVEVVLGMQDSTNPRNEIVPCAASYASMRFRLPNYHQSATNQSIPSINTLYSHELKQDEVANLTGTGYICIVPSIKRGFVAFSSKNLYPSSSFYSKPHYLRSLHNDVRIMTGFFLQYIGDPMSIVLLQSILMQINTYIDTLLKDHPIYQNVSIEVLDYTEEKVSLSLSFEFYGEVERVRTSFDYAPSSEVNVSWQ
jgi:hypothetical protein